MNGVGMVGMWDTSVLSRCLLAPGRMEAVFRRATEGDPIRVAAPAVLEVSYGLERAAERDARNRGYLKLLAGFVRDGTFRVVPLDGRAAMVAGRLRALSAHAPGARRGDRRSKAMRQAAWLLDIQIAATAFAGGLDVVTANRADFEQLSEQLANLFPSAPVLGVDSAFV